MFVIVSTYVDNNMNTKCKEEKELSKRTILLALKLREQEIKRELSLH